MKAGTCCVTRRQALLCVGMAMGMPLMLQGCSSASVWVPTSLEWRRLYDEDGVNYHESYEYDEAGNLTVARATMDDGWTNEERYEYDSQGYVTHAVLDGADTTTKESFDNDVDADGRITHVSRTDYVGLPGASGEYEESYSYYDNGMLRSETQTRYDGTLTTTYDEDGLALFIERVPKEDYDPSASGKSLLAFEWKRGLFGRIEGFTETLTVFSEQGDGGEAASEPYGVAYHVDVDSHGNVVKISEEANEWVFELREIPEPSNGARQRAKTGQHYLRFFNFSGNTPYAWRGCHNPPATRRKVTEVDASTGVGVTLEGVLYREINRDDGAFQEVFYMLKLDNEVTFSGLKGSGPSIVTTDSVKVGGAVNNLNLNGAERVPFDSLVNDKWEDKVGQRITCYGEIVGMASPHYAEVNMKDAKVL